MYVFYRFFSASSGGTKKSTDWETESGQECDKLTPEFRAKITNLPQVRAGCHSRAEQKTHKKTHKKHKKNIKN